MDSLNFSMIGSVPPLNRPPAPNNPPRAPSVLVSVVMMMVMVVIMKSICRSGDNGNRWIMCWGSKTTKEIACLYCVLLDLWVCNHLMVSVIVDESAKNWWPRRSEVGSPGRYITRGQYWSFIVIICHEWQVMRHCCSMESLWHHYDTHHDLPHLII